MTNENSSIPTDGSSTLSYAATTLPVVQGALALIVITFLGQVWPNIDPSKRLAAFELVYACGSHFIFSFAIAAPAALFLSRVQQSAVAVAFTIGLYSYTFWSLNVLHQGLANLLLDQRWAIPLPLGDSIWKFFITVFGTESTAQYLSPLFVSYLVALALSVVFGLVWPSSRQKQKP